MANEKILVVDDEIDVLELVRRILEAKGYSVKTATNGYQAIRLFQIEEFDLLLTDNQMPGITGLEIVKTARKYYPNLTCVLMTGFGTLDIVVEALRTHSDEFLMKPFTPSELSITISLAFRRKQEMLQNLTSPVAIFSPQLNVKNAELMSMKYLAYICGKNYDFGYELIQLTSSIGGVIHDLRNRLGILIGYTDQVKYALELLESMAFLRLKPALELRPCYGNPEQPEIAAKNISTHIRLWPKNSQGITAKGLIDAKLLGQRLSAFCATVEYLDRANGTKINKLQITDKLIQQPHLGFSIVISMPIRYLKEYFLMDFTNDKLITPTNLVQLMFFLLQKAIFFHNGTITIQAAGDIEIKIPLTSEVHISDTDMEKVKQESSSLAEKQMPLLVEYTFIEELITSLFTELKDIRLKAKNAANKKIQEIIQRNSQYAQLLLQNLLWLGAGMETPLESVNINEALESVRQIMRSEIRIRDAADDDDDDFIEVKLDLQPDLLPVLANQVNLQQVFMNLITNALEVMPRSGTLGLKTYQQAQNVMIEISDTGTGIKAEHLERIFELAFSTKQGQERGVGLHVVHSIVKKFGGKIEVKSEVDKGTTFIVSLPGQTA